MIVEHNATGIGELVQKVFPKNRKPINVVEFRGPQNVNSYWDGGSRDEYALVCLETGKVFGVPTSHPYFDRKESGERCGKLELRELPPNTALVCGGTFCGKPSRVTVKLRPENLVGMLPAPPEVSDDERKALRIVDSTISSYRRDAWDRAGLSGTYGADNPVIVGLVSKGLLKTNKRGAVSITVAGENAVS